MTTDSVPSPERSGASESVSDATTELVASSPFAHSEERLSRLERFLDRASEWVNPILVKESRQALKSRQFLTTFSILLLCCWVWSLLGVALRSPSIFYVPGGRYMLVGYFLIQNLPLTIIIPFAAYRSLAAEREDGTYELLSISTLKPRQIIAGKLGSAMLQMMIYLSVLAPCMAFTYLLRGVDILLVLSIVLLNAVGCWFLSSLGLLLATLTRARHWQVVVSVFLVLVLGVICFFSSMMVSLAVAQNAPIPFSEPEFWAGMGAIVTAILATGSMILLAAIAQITNRSENRSTILRIGMLVYHMLLLGWCTRFWLKHQEEEVLISYVIIGSIIWSLFGGLMMGESSTLSLRVRRGLPQSWLGKTFLTLFYPGHSTGYLFAVANMIVMYLATVALFIAKFGSGWTRDAEGVVAFVLTAGGYIAFYLGLSRLFVRQAARFTAGGPVMGLVVTLALVVVGSVVPLIVQYSIRHHLANGDDYTLMQVTNPFWTLAEIVDRISIGFAGWNSISVCVLAMGGAVLFMNLLTMSRQLTPTRVAKPRRVEQDDRDLHPVAEPVAVRSNPWDDPAHLG